MVFLSVVIPAYNEAKRLSHTLQTVLAYLRKQSYTWEVVVVDDGSRDRTTDLVRAIMKTEPQLKLLQYGRNHGKGFAVRYGLQRVSGQYRLFMDADNSTSLDHFGKFLPDLQAGYNIVIGSRDVPGAQVEIHQAWWKERLGDLGNVWIRFWAVPGIYDTQAGFKVFSAQAVEAVFPYLTLDGWAFDVEALAVAQQRGLRIAERPIRWLNDPDSKVKGGAYFNVLLEVVRVRLNIWRGLYDRE